MKIWKTPLTDHEAEVSIGEILHVGYDPKMPDAAACVWHYAEPAMPRTLYVVGTGPSHPLPFGSTHRGTAIRPDGFVFHVFEGPPAF